MSYELAANAEAEWFFSGGSIGANLAGENKKKLVVLKKVKKSAKILDTVQNLFSGVKLPRAVKRVSDIEEGNWLAIESYGSIEGGVKAQIGYDYNWIFDTDGKGLSGTQIKFCSQPGNGETF